MPDIDMLRKRCNEITEQIVRLLKERKDVASQIAGLKMASGVGVTDEMREGQLSSEVLSMCKEIGLDESLGKILLNFLLNNLFKVQSEEKQTHITIYMKAKQLERQGKSIIHMEVGEPDLYPPDAAKIGLEEAFDRGFVRYGPATGMPQLRSALAEHISRSVGVHTAQENIIVCPGARFSVYLAINTLLNPGEEIIVIEPAWPAYKECATNSRVNVRTIPTTLEGRWEPSIEQVEQAINSNTKMIVLNYPNNPTGKVLSPRLQEQIIDIARKNDLYVLSDEIYSLYSYSDWKSALASNYRKTVVTQSFSKSHGMTGFRIGYAVAEQKIIERMTKLQALCLTNVAELIQYAALKVLDSDVSSNKRVMKSKLDTLVAEAGRIDLDFAAPDGAMYIFARPKSEGFDGLRFVNKALDHGLAVAPGDGFGNYKEFLRISAAQSEDKIKEGIKILDMVLRESR